MLRAVLFVLLVSTGAAMGTISLVVLLRRQDKGVRWFTLLTFSLFCYTTGYAFELLSETLAGMQFWSRFEYLGIGLMLPAWVLSALRFSGVGERVRRHYWWAFFIIPVVTILLQWTNEFHSFFYATVGVYRKGPFPMFAFTPGPWYGVHVVYATLSILAGNILYVRMVRRAAPVYRKQATLFLVGSLFPWIGYIGYLAGAIPWRIDPTPILFPISAAAIAVGVLGFRMFDIVPVAQRQVFDSIRDAVIVLDNQNQLIDINLAVPRFFPWIDNSSLGRSMEQAFGAPVDGCPSLLGPWPESEDATISFSAGTPEAPRWCEARRFRLTAGRNDITGYLIIVADVTERTVLMARIADLAILDDLTGVYNRRQFLELAGREVTKSLTQGELLHLAIVDVDHLARVNDACGRAAGDGILRAVARLCRENVAPSATVGRLRGDEFGILMHGATSEEALEAAERVRTAATKDPENVDCTDKAVTVSIGITRLTPELLSAMTESGLSVSEDYGVGRDRPTYDKETTDALEALIAAADRGLYAAKGLGRNRVELYQPE